MLVEKKSLWFNFLIDFLLQTLLKKAILLHFMSFQTERNFISTTKIVSNILLKGPSQPYLCFCSHLRVWLQSLLIFYFEHVKMKAVTVKQLQITQLSKTQLTVKH